MTKGAIVWPLAILLGGLALAGLSGGYVAVATWGLPHNIWVLELVFMAGTIAALAAGLWLMGMALRRLLRS